MHETDNVVGNLRDTDDSNSMSYGRKWVMGPEKAAYRGG
jgi:hypothetical protein